MDNRKIDDKEEKIGNDFAMSEGILNVTTSKVRTFIRDVKFDSEAKEEDSAKYNANLKKLADYFIYAVQYRSEDPSQISDSKDAVSKATVNDLYGRFYTSSLIKEVGKNPKIITELRSDVLPYVRQRIEELAENGTDVWGQIESYVKNKPLAANNIYQSYDDFKKAVENAPLPPKELSRAPKRPQPALPPEKKPVAGTPETDAVKQSSPAEKASRAPNRPQPPLPPEKTKTETQTAAKPAAKQTMSPAVNPAISPAATKQTSFQPKPAEPAKEDRESSFKPPPGAFSYTQKK